MDGEIYSSIGLDGVWPGSRVLSFCSFHFIFLPDYLLLKFQILLLISSLLSTYIGYWILYYWASMDLRFEREKVNATLPLALIQYLLLLD